MCNRSWMEIATFDYKVHAVLEEIEISCHFPRHADIHFLWLCMITTNTILTLAGIPRRACSQSTDTGTTWQTGNKERLPQDCQIGRIWDPPPTHTQIWLSVHVLYTVVPWYHASGVYGQYCCDNCICLWGLSIIQRTHAKQCNCMSECHQMPSTVSPLQHSIYYKTYEKNVTACQKAKCFFHGMPRERDRMRMYMNVWGQQRVSHVSGDNRPSGWHTGCMQSCEPVEYNW